MKKVLKIVLVAVNLVLIVLLIGSTMAGKVAPSRFIGFSLLSYCYLYLLIANLLFVLIWLVKGSKWFLASIVAIVARYGFLPLYFQVGGTAMLNDSEVQEECLKLLTYNVHRFSGVEDGVGRVDSNMLNFLAIVDEESPDLLAMQEYIGKGDTLPLTKRLMERGYTNIATGYENGSVTGEVIFSKLPLIRVVRVEGPSKLYASLMWGDDTLRLYCLHLNSYGLDESDQQQIHDLSRGNVDKGTGRGTLHKFRETIVRHEQEWQVLQPYFESHERLILVAGDFNETPSSYFYQQTRQYLQDSYCEVGQGFSTTYHGLFTRQNHTIFPAFRIDMVLHSSDIEACSYKRIKSEISDHYPIVVTLKKKDQR